MSEWPQPFDPPIWTSRMRTESTVIVIGVDGSDSSWDAFWWACGEVRRLGARAVAVFVSPLVCTRVGSSPSDLVPAVATDHAWRDQIASKQAEKLRRRAELYAADHGVDLTFVHARGDPPTELLRIATAHGADQIVLGRSAKACHHVAISLGRRLNRNSPGVVVVL